MQVRFPKTFCTITGLPELEVSWFWTKSINKRKDRSVQKYPIVLPATKYFLKSFKVPAEIRPWQSTAAEINKVLEGETTSLVFRRAADARFMSLGISEEMRSRKLTHANVKMIRAHYGVVDPRKQPAPSTKKQVGSKLKLPS